MAAGSHHGLPRFARASFDAAYPFGQVHLSDPALPVRVTLKGFNPLVTGDADASGKPLAVLSYEVENLTDAPLEVSVCGSLRNFIGKDGSRFTSNWKGDFIPAGASRNQNEYRDRGGVRGARLPVFGCGATDGLHRQAGEIFLEQRLCLGHL